MKLWFSCQPVSYEPSFGILSDSSAVSSATIQLRTAEIDHVIVPFIAWNVMVIHEGNLLNPPRARSKSAALNRSGVLLRFSFNHAIKSAFRQSENVQSFSTRSLFKSKQNSTDPKSKRCFNDLYCRTRSPYIHLGS